MKPLFVTENPRELPEALGRIRADLAGRGPEFDEALEAGRRTESGAKAPRGVRSPEAREAALEVLRGLEAEGPGFDLGQAERALEAAGLAAQLLEGLLEESLLYEVGHGRYRVA